MNRSGVPLLLMIVVSNRRVADELIECGGPSVDAQPKHAGAIQV